MIRLVLGTYMSYNFLSDIYAMRASIPIASLACCILANVTTHTLNFYWFSKLVISIVQHKKKSTSQAAAKRAKNL